ncbi:MAG TPA: DNA topoisomerase III [Candidatus Acidoferrum sp.]|jgi:DNA topoisomerase-3|nr:DNA topoisomerase III [Candidatus Acidoferrum sp.]
MGKALIIAEKPSVASDIARALGGFKKQEDYYESDQYVLSSAVGHLLELVVPEGVEPARGKWSFAHLPVIPPHFDLQPIEKAQARLNLLKKLLKRKDVAALINACDAGREGELIFRNIIRYANARQPIQRLWLQSMTPAAIRDGFAQLRDDQQMQPLADAALSRAEADWLVGINGTRAMTAFNSKSGGFFKTTVGRVQTPTLAIVVEREQKIRRFVSRDYWEVIGTFQAEAGTYIGKWFDEKFVRPDKEGDPDLKPDRLWDRATAEALRSKCLGKPGIVTEESKPSTQLSPLLYDLTSLQREANSRFGFSASNTLKLAQTLYERHKVLTYPRTDSRALPEDYQGTVRKTLEMLEGTAYRPFADTILKNEWVRPNKRIFNNAKVSDHFAIIPTTEPPKGLSEPEQKLYDMVTKRFLAVFYPAAEFLETIRITRVEHEPFKSVGKVLLNPGWMAVYGKEAQSEDAPTLTPVKAGEQVQTTEVEVKQNQTKPPPRYTEATLLGAMEGAGKLVEDEELREAMSEKGLGTPATRAAIIEGLIYEQYLLRQGKDLQATAKAFALMELLNGLGIPELTRPELTGDWEFQLRQVQRRQKSRSEFMAGIQEMTRHIVERAKKFELDTIPGDFGVLKVPCPKCGGEVHERYKAFQCVKCDFSVWKIISSRLFEAEEMEQLISNKQIGPLQGFRSRMGKPFAAVLKLNEENKIEFDFGPDQRNGEGGVAEVDFTGQEPVGQCPKCQSRVFETAMSYICEKSVGASRSCKFRTGKIILQQPIERSQVQKLLAAGKTDRLDKFISRKGRPFKAFLVLKDGEVGFEFEPRPARGKKGAAKTQASKEPAPKIDFTGQQPLGKCPKCGGQVFESESAYVCEKSQADKRPCKFKINKVILQQPIERTEAAKLLAENKSGLLTQFISKAGRPFPAYLVMDDMGKVNFEFPPRETEPAN